MSVCVERWIREEETRYTMPLRTVDYIDVAARAKELGCRVPVGIALLPGNFATAAGAKELRYHEAAPEVRSAWRGIGLIDAGPNLMLEHALARGPDATGPDVPLVAFFGRELSSSPPRLFTYALGAVASVLAAHPGCVNPEETQFDAVVEGPGHSRYVCLEYRGNPCELLPLADTIRGILAGDPGFGSQDYAGV